MPGRRLLNLARAWFDDTTVARVFEPLVADWRAEDRSRGAFARVRAYASLYSSFAMSFALALPRQLKSPVPESVRLGAWMVAAAFVGVGVLVLIVAFYGASAGRLHLIPAALGVAVPLALVPTAIVLSRLGTAVCARMMALRIALFAMLVLVPLLAWWMPVSNQEWRTRHVPSQRIVLRGAREITAAELFSPQAPYGAFPELAANWNATRVKIVSERSAVLVMPLTMALFGLAVASVFRRAPAVVAFGSWCVVGVMWMTPLDASPWLPHACLLLFTVGVKPLRRSRG